MNYPNLNPDLNTMTEPIAALSVLAESRIEELRKECADSKHELLSRVTDLTDKCDGYERMWRSSAVSEYELKCQVAKLEARIEKLKNKGK